MYLWEIPATSRLLTQNGASKSTWIVGDGILRQTDTVTNCNIIMISCIYVVLFVACFRSLIVYDTCHVLYHLACAFFPCHVSPIIRCFSLVTVLFMNPFLGAEHGRFRLFIIHMLICCMLSCHCISPPYQCHRIHPMFMYIELYKIYVVYCIYESLHVA